MQWDCDDGQPDYIQKEDARKVTPENTNKHSSEASDDAKQIKDTKDSLLIIPTLIQMIKNRNMKTGMKKMKLM